MPLDSTEFNLKDYCHVNTNEDGDRFVGIKADSDNIMVYFPLGYELSKDNNGIRKDIKNLFQILRIFTDKSDRTIHSLNYNKWDSVEFPIQAYFNVINYYLAHNGKYYIESESSYKLGSHGKVNWNRTIKIQKPLIQNNSPIYLKTVIRYTTPNNTRMITRINKSCVYEAFKKIGWLYTNNEPEIPDLKFDKNLFLSILNDKLAVTNNDNDKELFNSMISMINFMDYQTNYKYFYYGTDTFETVWEKLIDRYFGEKNKDEYFPHAKWTERYGGNKGKLSSALEPDSIMIYNGKYYILDAKYYKYGVYPEFGVSLLPQSSDINKQITYAQYVKRKKTDVNSKVFNAFLMPFNSYNNIFGSIVEYQNVAEASGDWINNPETYEKVQGIVIDTSYLLKNYDGNHLKDKELLSKEIEKYINID